MLKRFAVLFATVFLLVACGHKGDKDKSSTLIAPVNTDSATTTAANTQVAKDEATDASIPASSPSSGPLGLWVEGKNYFLIKPAQPTHAPGKVVVTQVFSFGCPACNAFNPVWDKLKHSLPSSVVVAYLPVSFNPAEKWPLFQRAYFTARALNVAEKSHTAMFDAVWKPGGKLGIYNLSPSGRSVLKPAARMPTLESIAAFYAHHYGIKPAKFIDTAHSFSVNTQMKKADDQAKAFGIRMTPSIIINGKYRVTPVSAGGYSQMIALTQWLITRELAAPEK